MPIEPESVRLDKWLWAARFFKTRKLATEAIAGGKVHLNGQRTKPGKDVKTGNSVAISKDGLHWEVTVIALTAQRRSAKEAVLLYEESPESLDKRLKQIAERKEQRELFDFDAHAPRPNKKDRRLIHRFKRVESISGSD